MKYIVSVLLILLLVVATVIVSSSPSSNSNDDDLDWWSSSSSSDGPSSGDSSYELDYYLYERQKLVDAENEIKLGSFLHLNSQELKANSIFKAFVESEELILSNNDPSGINFLSELSTIQDTQVWNIIRKMPKGSLLHVHQDSSATYDYLVEVGSYLPNCYYYTSTEGEQGFGNFRFFSQQPSDPNWVLLSLLRQQQPNVTEFDQQLLLNLTLFGQDDGDYVNLWRKFDRIFGLVSGLVTYVPITLGYMEHIVNESLADNIQHIEMRKCFGDYYDLEGNTYNDTWFLQQTMELVERVQTTYGAPEFTIKIIGCDGRHTNRSVVLEHMKYALQLRNQFPQVFIGYDLVGPEDEGYPLIYFIDQFMEIQELSKSYQYPLNYYFHAGETLLYNNTNLYDAVLLNTVRIGHGLQLTKHPILMDIVKERNIGIEVCPISNQVLEFYSNFRTHPAFDMFNDGMPITISPDDPAIYGYSGITFDFYEVTYGWGLDLSGLKQLVINSMTYSTYYDDTEKNNIYQAWLNQWNNFIEYILTLTPPPLPASSSSDDSL